MTLVVTTELLGRIEDQGEDAYPEEAAGFLLGVAGTSRVIMDIIPARNLGIEGARRNRYMIGPEEYVLAEVEAGRRRMDVLGIYHSHPDHPAEPSGFDREWAQPNFVYLITSIERGKAAASKSWVLLEDRSHFEEEVVGVTH